MTGNRTLTNGQRTGRVQVEIENVGGISSADVSFADGVTLVSGQNASNKSSFLRSLAGVLGGPVPQLKSDTDEGFVRLQTGDRTHTLALARRDGETTVTDEDTYTEGTGPSHLFYALIESNPVRRAVVSGEDLSEYLMAPVDTDAIAAEIDALRAKRDELDQRLEELDRMNSRLPGLQAQAESLRSEMAETEASLEAARDTVQELEATTDEAVETDLREQRSRRNEIRDRLRTQRSAVDSLESELDDVVDRLETLGDVDAETTVDELEDELETLHYRKQQLTSTINALSPVVEMNEQLLDEAEEVPDPMTSDDVVSELDPSSRSVTCWTCGSTVEQAQIAEQVDSVRSIIEEKRTGRDAVTERIQVLTEQQRDLESKHGERDRLRERRTDLTDELDRRRDTVGTLEAELREVETEIEALQREHEASTQDDRLTELYDEISDLEYERGRLESDLAAAGSEIEEIEAALSERDEVEARRESVAADLRAKRDRVEEIERDLVETFNEMMQRVLEVLSYDSIERIWLERRSTDDSRSLSEFQLHIVREGADGTAYEDTADTLSKSEREVIGLVVGLAGYLVHDVAETMPFVIIDAVEMFDEERIQPLLELFADHAEYVVATVLPSERPAAGADYELLPSTELAG